MNKIQGKYLCEGVCGSPLHSTYLDRPDVIGIPLGALEGVESSPEAHIFVGSKATWYQISDNLPQYLEWPGNESQVRTTKDYINLQAQDLPGCSMQDRRLS